MKKSAATDNPNPILPLDRIQITDPALDGSAGANRAQIAIKQIKANTDLEAIQEFKKDEVISGVLGEYVSNIYISKKEQEWNAYKKQVTKWEIDQYIYKY